MSQDVRLDNLRPNAGSTRGRKRVGRGQGSGRGGTSTRGHKGAKSRSGYSRKMGFEGGQMPLQRRLPKFGFTNPFRVEYTVLNLSDLQRIAESKSVQEITPEILHALGEVKKRDKVKILGGGELSKKLSVVADAFSASAKQAIEAQGGTTKVR
ncbi:MAG: 50S ribosomal protein L15 [Bacteroidia bacterium]|nr:MAG: 50S ribosomal protein L15 [Bacteroidia bacterium]